MKFIYDDEREKERDPSFIGKPHEILWWERARENTKDAREVLLEKPTKFSDDMLRNIPNSSKNVQRVFENKNSMILFYFLMRERDNKKNHKLSFKKKSTKLYEDR